jgi:surface antigen
MRLPMIALAGAMAMAVSACETTGAGYNQAGYGNPVSNLSSCQRNALLGAAGGAVLGGLTAGKGAKTEGAVVGAAVGGLGTYGVCRYLDNQSVSRVEQGYQYSLNNNAPYSTSWQGQGGTQNLYVAQPTAAGANCKRLSSTLTVPGEGKQNLPPETYCRGPDGVWRPAAA